MFLKNSPFPAVPLSLTCLNPQYEKAGPPTQNKLMSHQTRLTCPSNFSAHKSEYAKSGLQKTQATNSKTTFLTLSGVVEVVGLDL